MTGRGDGPTVNRTLEAVLLLSVPGAAMLAAGAEPLAAVLLARGEPGAAMGTALAAVGVNLGLNLLLMGPMGHAGIALATAVAAWVQAALLGGRARCAGAPSRRTGGWGGRLWAIAADGGGERPGGVAGGRGFGRRVGRRGARGGAGGAGRGGPGCVRAGVGGDRGAAPARAGSGGRRR